LKYAYMNYRIVVEKFPFFSAFGYTQNRV
jgi:hypothetical protein